MFNQYIVKALDSNDDYTRKGFVFFDKGNQNYVATDGHKLFIERTSDEYESDCFLSKRTGKKVNLDENYYNYLNVIMKGKEIKEKEFKTYTRKEKSKCWANKLVCFSDKYFDADFIKDAFDFIGKEFTLSINDNVLRIDSNDNIRTAIIISTRGDLEEYIEDSETYNPENNKTKLKKVKYVWVSYGKDGEVLGIFSKKNDAFLEGARIEEKPIL